VKDRCGSVDWYMNFWTAKFKARLLLTKYSGPLLLLITLFATQRNRAAVREVVPGLYNYGMILKYYKIKAKVRSYESYDYYFRDP
jgi:hypothetical protein